MNEKLTDFSQRNSEEQQFQRIQAIVDYNNKLIENHFTLVQESISANIQENLAQQELVYVKKVEQLQAKLQAQGKVLH